MDFLGMPELERDVKLEGCGNTCNTLLNLILHVVFFQILKNVLPFMLVFKKSPAWRRASSEGGGRIRTGLRVLT
jgi:hypothetical protein